MSVERELYGTRAAEMAGVTAQVMQIEISRAYKRRTAAAKKAKERQELEIAASRQPKARELRYDNLRSAVAEENLLCMLLAEPNLFARCAQVKEECFSVPMFARVYKTWSERWSEGLTPCVSDLSETLSSAEMSHLTMLLQENSGPVSEDAFDDFVRVILYEHRHSRVEDVSDLRALQESLRKKKGYGGT